MSFAKSNTISNNGSDLGRLNSSDNTWKVRTQRCSSLATSPNRSRYTTNSSPWRKPPTPPSQRSRPRTVVPINRRYHIIPHNSMQWDIPRPISPDWLSLSPGSSHESASPPYTNGQIFSRRNEDYLSSFVSDVPPLRPVPSLSCESSSSPAPSVNLAPAARFHRDCLSTIAIDATRRIGKEIPPIEKETIPHSSINVVSEDCPICMEKLISVHDNPIIGTAVPCGHCFHRDCYEATCASWKSNTCPTCRKPVSSFIQIYITSHNNRIHDKSSMEHESLRNTVNAQKRKILELKNEVNVLKKSRLDEIENAATTTIPKFLKNVGYHIQQIASGVQYIYFCIRRGCIDDEGFGQYGRFNNTFLLLDRGESYDSDTAHNRNEIGSGDDNNMPRSGNWSLLMTNQRMRVTLEVYGGGPDYSGSSRFNDTSLDNNSQSTIVSITEASSGKVFE